MPKKQAPRKRRSSFLTPDFLERQKSLLCAKLADCRISRKLALQKIKTLSPDELADELDRTLTASERERVARQLEECGKIFPLAEKALQLIDNSLTKKGRCEEEYGICLNCREPIPQKRLNAVPWALCCVPCQEEADMPLSTEFLLEDSLA